MYKKRQCAMNQFMKRKQNMKNVSLGVRHGKVGMQWFPLNIWQRRLTLVLADEENRCGASCTTRDIQFKLSCSFLADLAHITTTWRKRREFGEKKKKTSQIEHSIRGQEVKLCNIHGISRDPSAHPPGSAVLSWFSLRAVSLPLQASSQPNL